MKKSSLQFQNDFTTLTTVPNRALAHKHRHIMLNIIVIGFGL